MRKSFGEICKTAERGTFRLLLLVALLAAVCGAPVRAFGAETDGGDCYVDLHKLNDVSVPYNPYQWEPSDFDEIVRRVGDYVGYRSDAFVNCEKAFAAGDARSGFWLGEYLNSAGKIKESIPYYEKSAAMGDPYALHLMGWVHALGKLGMKKDVEKGLEYIKLAADAGSGQSQFMYAHFYDRVRSMERDLPLAWEYYHRAAASGNTSAMVKLGAMYLFFGTSGECGQSGMSDGYVEVVKKEYAPMSIVCDEEKGLDYMTRAAALGDASAILSLAGFYERKGDAEEAMKWHSLHWEWDYSDTFYINSLAYSPSLWSTDLADYDELCNRQHISQKYIEQHGQGETAVVDDWVAETQNNIAPNHCQYSDYQWYYTCQPGENDKG